MSYSKHFRNVYVVCDVHTRTELTCFSSTLKAKKAVDYFNEEEKKFRDSLSKDLKMVFPLKKFCIIRLTVR